MNVNDFDLPQILVRVIAAVVILIVTAVIAKLVKSLLSKQLVKIKPLDKHGDSGTTLGESLATVASLIIWLFGLMAVLNLFDLTTVVAPIQNLLDGLLGALPGVIGAALIFFVGYVVARILREIVTTSLQAAGADRRLAQLQGSADRSSGTGSTADVQQPAADATATTGTATPSVKVSEVTGQLVFALVLIVVSISALQVLGIESISEPATEMLNLILAAVPRIIAAAILLGLGYLIGKFVAPLLESVLRSLGTDRALSEVGISTRSTSASLIVARTAHVAIVLFFAIAATRVLGFPEITAILDTVLEIGGQVLFGGAVIAVGVLVANVLAGLASGQAATVVRWATIGLFVAMGLQFMGLADTIVTLAFGSVVVGTALAAALAFGLGGRDAAARQLERLQSRPSGAAARPTASSDATPGHDPLT